MAVIASILGTYEDFQGYEDQKEKLEQEGVIVMPSNAQAARLSALIASRGVITKTLFEGDA